MLWNSRTRSLAQESFECEFKSIASVLEFEPKTCALHEAARHEPTPEARRAARARAVEADAELQLKTVSNYLCRYINAFLNTEGGTIFFGIEDKVISQFNH